MYVIDKEMYHFHNNKAYNELWVPNNEIIVDDNFKTFYLRILKNYSTAVNTTDGGKESFDRIIKYYLEKEQDKETLIKLLKEAENIIRGINICKRELALERVREAKYPNLPSRAHSIWLCNESGIKFWEDQLSNGGKIKLDLYKVSVTGTLFISSDKFLPNDDSDYETNLVEAEKYWNPKFETNEDEKAEYLFQGKLKILKRVD